MTYVLAHSRDVPVTDLVLDQETRQRTDHDVGDILPSIKERGVWNPIIVDENLNIVAGARRYLAAIEAGLVTVPVRDAAGLTQTERKILELEENTRRKNLSWQEACNAYATLHDLYVQMDPEWTGAATAEALSVSPATISHALAVSAAMKAGNKAVLNASGFSAAVGLLSRARERRIEDAMVELAEGLIKPKPAPPAGTPPPPRILPPDQSIIQADFNVWAQTYDGPKFNFLHCDFPYGIHMDDSEQGKSGQYDSYADTPEVYSQLISTLTKNLDNFLSPSAHIIFWLSADSEIIAETIRRFHQEAPSITWWPRPLIWHKTDNRGIIQDAQRGPRHIYETALFGSRGDRKIVKSVSDLYGAPTSKTFHQSTKSEPMLRHFFSMIVDDTTSMLDPTCGSGSALRAAEGVGAKTTLGLEVNPEYVEQARQELRRFRVLKSAADGVKK